MKKSLNNFVKFMQIQSYEYRGLHAIPTQCTGSSSYAGGGGANI
ncbi:MAG: hypothetical protein ACLSWI_06325 [Candidatus Gastranaerophilaceae bacterium]